MRSQIISHYREILTIEILWPGEVDDSVTNLSILAQFAQVMAKAVIMRPLLQKMKENFGSDILSCLQDWFFSMYHITYYDRKCLISKMVFIQLHNLKIKYVKDI